MSHITGWMYNCDLCNRHFPIWMVSDEEWAKAGFDALVDPPADVCKRCFEDVCGEPNYLTAEEYVQDQTIVWGITRDETDASTFDKIRAKMLAELLEVWNTPEETDKHRICRKSAEYTVSACLVSGEQQRCEKKFVEFVEEHPTFVGLTEGTIRPLLREKNEEVRVTAIESIEKSLESGKNPVTGKYTDKLPSESDVKKVLKKVKIDLIGNQILIDDDIVKPIINQESYETWLNNQPMCDLLITDPPYMTDVDDIHGFAEGWLPMALNKVKSTGRAYVCIGAYPNELYAYLSASKQVDMVLANILVWTYRNTLGPSPNLDYKQNWQAILYFRGIDAGKLDCPLMTEQFSVQDINAPDGRLGDRYHEWQKPDELAERLIRHSTKEDDLVLDPFAGTGTFLLAATRLGRTASGCDINPEILKIAEERGCKIE